MNIAVLLDEVSFELLCRTLYVFPHNVLAVENSHKAVATVLDIITLVKVSCVRVFSLFQH